MHDLLKHLAKLPQFQSQALYGCVVHLQTGCTVSMYDSVEPKYAEVFNLRWPGQPTDVRMPADANKYIELMQAEARLLDL